jgi:hypothetical protein
MNTTQLEQLKEKYENKEMLHVSAAIFEFKGVLIRHFNIEPINVLSVQQVGNIVIANCRTKDKKTIQVTTDSDSFENLFDSIENIPSAKIQSYDTFLSIKSMLQQL